MRSCAMNATDYGPDSETDRRTDRHTDGQCCRAGLMDSRLLAGCSRRLGPPTVWRPGASGAIGNGCGQRAGRDGERICKLAQERRARLGVGARRWPFARQPICHRHRHRATMFSGAPAWRANGRPSGSSPVTRAPRADHVAKPEGAARSAPRPAEFEFAPCRRRERHMEQIRAPSD